jgi:hypothetical protein
MVARSGQFVVEASSNGAKKMKRRKVLRHQVLPDVQLARALRVTAGRLEC